MIKHIAAAINYMIKFPRHRQAINAIYQELANQLRDLWELDRLAATVTFAQYLNEKMPLPEEWTIEFDKAPAEKCNAGDRAIMACSPAHRKIFVDPDKLHVMNLVDMMQGLRHEWQHVMQAYEILNACIAAGHPEYFGEAWDRFLTKGGYVFNELELDARSAACAELRAPFIDLHTRTRKYVAKIIESKR